MQAKLYKFRGHHLLCVLTYSGVGYSNNFVRNFNMIAQQLNDGAVIQVTRSFDDICKGWDLGGCPRKHGNHCREDVIHQRDLKAITSLNEHVFSTGFLAPGQKFIPAPTIVHRMRINFTKGTIRAACADCEWHQLCTQIAGRGYKDVRLLPGAKPVAWTTIVPSYEEALYL